MAPVLWLIGLTAGPLLLVKVGDLLNYLSISFLRRQSSFLSSSAEQQQEIVKIMDEAFGKKRKLMYVRRK